MGDQIKMLLYDLKSKNKNGELILNKILLISNNVLVFNGKI